MNVPAATGANVTLSLHLLPVAKVPTQFCDGMNKLLPEVIAEIVTFPDASNGPLPFLFTKVTVFFCGFTPCVELIFVLRVNAAGVICSAPPGVGVTVAVAVGVAVGVAVRLGVGDTVAVALAEGVGVLASVANASTRFVALTLPIPEAKSQPAFVAYAG